MRYLPLVLLSLASLTPLSAYAQWQWVDGSGRRVFSDAPPPPDVPERNILSRPAGVRSAPPTVSLDPPGGASTAAAAASAPASAPRVATRDRELEERKRQADKAEEDKRKALEAEIAKRRAEACQAAKRAIAGYTSGQRLVVINDKGQREVMDDATRQRELARVQAFEQAECR